MSIFIKSLFLIGAVFSLVSAQFLPLDCPSDCTSVTVDMSYVQCRCDNDTEISTSCLVSFGWYDDVVTPCQFASHKTQEFSVTWAWNNYKDCGGSTSPPCEYVNGTWVYSEFDDHQLDKPFAWSMYSFHGNADSARALHMKGSEISGYGRLLVTPVYTQK